MKHNKSYKRYMFNQMKQICATYFLHNLQEKASGFHNLIRLLNSCRDLVFNILRYQAHILGPRFLIDCMS